jgi:hypothetical protein
MTEDNEQYAYFTITDSFDPAEVTRRVGVEATDSWRRGDLNPRNRMERRFSRWSLYSRLEKTAELEDHIRDVLAQLDENTEAFQSISMERGGCMQLVGYWKVEYPGLRFDRDIVEGLAKYKLSVDFDFYYLYSDGREDT